MKMGSKMKKVLAVMLSLVLLTGIVPISASAETSVTLTPNNDYLSTNALYLNSNVSFSGTNVSLIPYNNEGVVKCDSTELSVFSWGGRGYTLTTSGWNTSILILTIYADAAANKENFSADSVYTISGKFQDSSSGTVYEFEELSVQCTYNDNGDNVASWSVVTSVQAESATLTPDNEILATNALYLNSSVSFSGTSVSLVPYNNEGVVKCDSTELSVFNWGGRGYTLTTSGWSTSVLILQIYADAAANKENFSADSVYTISGKFQDSSSGNVYEFEELRLTCTYDDGGTSLTGWSEYIEQVQLAKPILSISGNTVSWSAVENATNYEVHIDDEKKADTTGTSYDLSMLGLGIGSYQVTVQATGDASTVSATSDAVTYTISATNVTIIPDGTSGNNKVVYLKFSGLSSCQKYIPLDGYVKLDGTELRYTVDTYNEIDYAILAGWSNVHYVQLTNQLGTTYAFAEGSILEIGGTFEGEDGTIIDIAEIKLVCDSNYNWSEYVEQIELAKPVLSISGNTASWNAVDNATNYEVYVDGEKKADTTETSYDLSLLGLGIGSYQVTVQATGNANTVSATSDAVTYTISATNVTIIPDGTSGNNKVVYLKFSGLSSCQKYIPLDGYVKLDGTELRYTVDTYNEIDYAILAGWSNVHYVQLTNQLGTTYAFAEGSVLEIGGTFEGADGTIINIAEIKLVCDSNYNWSEYVVQIELTKPVLSVSGNAVSWNAVDNATNYEVYVDGEKKADTTGTTYDLSALGLGLGSYQVTVKATGGENTVSATSDAVTYTIAPIELGTMIIDSVSSIAPQFNNFYVDVNSSGVTATNMVDNQNYMPIDDGSGVFLNGNKLPNGYINDFGWCPNIFFKDDITDERELVSGDTLIVKGTFRYGTEQFTVTETTFIWNGSAWSKYVPLETIYNVTLAPHNVHNSANTVYITATTDQTISFESDKNFRPGAYNGKVSLNDIVLTEGTDYIMMTSYSPNNLYLVQLQGGRTWTIGDKLTISGQFAYNGSAEGIEVANYTMWYDGLVWTTTEVTLRTPGDLNDDGDWTSLDLVKMKKYIHNGVASEYKVVTELTGNDLINDDDVQELRYIILGKRHVIDGRTTSKYFAVENINIFADGPVVQNDEALLKSYFNAGFTTLLMTEDFSTVWGDDGNTSITNADGTLDVDYKNSILTAMKYGDVMIRNHSNSADYFTDSLYQQLYDLGIRQFYIWDEPAPKNNGFFGFNSDEGDIPSVATMATNFASILPTDTMFHVNLFPSYGAGNGSSWGGKITYTEYVDQYVADVLQKLPNHAKTLSVDNYPLMSDNTIRSTYLRDLWYVGNKAKDANATVNYCIQAYSQPGNTEIRKPETRADLSFQTNTGLALGAQSFEYFEYYDYSPSTDSITGILANGLYEEVQSINRELKAWDHVFLSFDWQGVKTYNVDSTYTSGVTQLSSLQMISNIESSAATLVGEYQYSDNTSEYGYMITNFTEPSQGTTDNVTLTMDANQEVLVYTNGIGRWMTADANGELTLSISAGGGVFVIPQ